MRRTGKKVIAKVDPVQVFRDDISGYWCIYTTSEKNAANALETSMERNEIELLFDNLKNAFDCNLIRVHKKAAMQGRLFIQFIVLVILMELTRSIGDQWDELKKYGNYCSVLKQAGGLVFPSGICWKVPGSLFSSAKKVRKIFLQHWV